MKRLVMHWGALALCLCGAAAPAWGQAAAEAEDTAMQPLVVVSLKSFEELASDLDYVGGLSGNSSLGGVEGVLELIGGGQLVESMDQTKPWGLAISSDGLEFQILGFLPIKDLEAFLEAVGGVGGGATEVEEDVWQMSLQGFTLCFKQQGEWTYASLSPDFLKNLPDDPTKLVAGLDTKHDLSAAIHVQNIPEVFRQLLVEQVKQMVMQNLSEMPGSESATGDLQRVLLERQFQSLTLMSNDVEVVKFGGSIDKDAHKSTMDVEIVALEGSPLAAKMNETAAARTRFSGFVMADAMAAMNMRWMLPPVQIEELKGTIEEVRAQLKSQLENIQLLDDQGIKERAIDIVNRLIDLTLVAPIEAGALDVGFAMAGSGPYTLLAGSHNPQADELQKLLEEFANMLETEAGFYGFQLDVAKHNDVRFHSVSIPLPGGEIGDQLTELFGFDMELTFGIGPQSSYLAIGGGGVDKLKAAIDASAAGESQTNPPLVLNLQMAPLLKLLAAGDAADPNLSLMASQVEPGKDKVTVVGESIERGMHLHVEAEEGLVKILPTIISTIGLPAGLPGF